MGIFDKLRKKDPAPEVQQTPQVKPQEQNIVTQSQALIGELVKDLDAPNKAIINDLILLISTLSKNPDPNLDMANVLQTAELLIHQLVSTIPNPDQKIIDELLRLIAVSNTSTPVTLPPNVQQTQEQAALAAGTVQPAQQEQPLPIQQPQVAQPTQQPALQQPVEQQVQQPTAPAQQAQATPQQTPTQQAVEQPPQQEAQTPEKEETKEPEKPPEQKEVKDDNINKHMLNLIMDQTKDVVKVTSELNAKIKDLEAKTNNKVTSHEETLEEIHKKLAEYESHFTEIQKAMDKFIGLYEIITNQFNPFIKNEEEAPKQEAPPSPPPSPPPTQQAPVEQTQAPPAPQPPQQAQSVPQQPVEQAPQVQQPTAPAQQAPQPTPTQQPTPPETPQPAAEAPPNQQTIPVEEHSDDHKDIENLPSDPQEMVKFLRGASDSEYDALIKGDKNLLAEYAAKVMQSAELEKKLNTQPPKAEAVKEFVKANLRKKIHKKED